MNAKKCLTEFVIEFLLHSIRREKDLPQCCSFAQRQLEWHRLYAWEFRQLFWFEVSSLLALLLYEPLLDSRSETKKTYLR